MRNTVLSMMGRRWRELAGFALLFRMFESLLFAPAAALAGKWLLGRTVLDSTALISFALSLRGFVALALAAITALTIRLVEHAGLSAIFFGAFDDRRVSAREALRLVWRHLLKLVRVAARFVGAGLLTMLPLLAVAGAFAARLLSRRDINYYLKLRPPEFIVAVVVIGVVALGTMAVILWLVVRWRWAVQAVLFQQREARRAFAESAALTRGLRWKLTLVLVGVVLLSIALGAAASLLGDASTSVMLGVMGQSVSSLAISFGVLLLVRAIIGAVCSFLGSAVDAGAFTSLYRRRIAVAGVEAAIPDTGETGRLATPRWLPAALIAGLLAVTAGGTWLALDAIPDERPITIHAHRGVAIHAPENTLAAVREAIAAGADYIETDVQLSRDDVLVVAHDSDFSRLAGVATKVWDLTYDEIRAIPLGGRAAPEYRNEIAPTFDALLAETKGRIRVNIELKYYGDHQPGLARKVIDAVRARGMLDQVVIQCLEYEPLLEVRQLAPEVPVGYLLSFNAREPSRLDVDFLSVEQNRLDRAFIMTAQRRGQQVYAWTVNTAEDMERFFDLGIDGVITDQAALARMKLDQYLSRPKPERAIRRVRAWLAD
jgi:glycerophosphoryl diester phosphodiesterase